MKQFFALIAIMTTLSSTLAFAGPEDHYAQQTCYNMTAEGLKQKPESVPYQVCFEKAFVNLDKDQVVVRSYTQIALFEGLYTTELVRHTEDLYRYTAQAVLNTQKDESAILTLKGYSDVYGNIPANSIDIKIEYFKFNKSTNSVDKFTYTYLL